MDKTKALKPEALVKVFLTPPQELSLGVFQSLVYKIGTGIMLRVVK